MDDPFGNFGNGAAFLGARDALPAGLVIDDHVLNRRDYASPFQPGHSNAGSLPAYASPFRNNLNEGLEAPERQIPGQGRQGAEGIPGAIFNREHAPSPNEAVGSWYNTESDEEALQHVSYVLQQLAKGGKLAIYPDLQSQLLENSRLTHTGKLENVDRNFDQAIEHFQHSYCAMRAICHAWEYISTRKLEYDEGQRRRQRDLEATCILDMFALVEMMLSGLGTPLATMSETME